MVVDIVKGPPAMQAHYAPDLGVLGVKPACTGERPVGLARYVIAIKNVLLNTRGPGRTYLTPSAGRAQGQGKPGACPDPRRGQLAVREKQRGAPYNTGDPTMLGVCVHSSLPCCEFDGRGPAPLLGFSASSLLREVKRVRFRAQSACFQHRCDSNCSHLDGG